jgi:DNA ligase (NAD+)
MTNSGSDRRREAMIVKELEEKIAYYAQKYYEGNPEISDAEFDKLVSRLVELNPTSEVLFKTGWGYNPHFSPLQKVEHKYGKMTGIAIKYDVQSFIKNTKHQFYTVTTKLDGASVGLYYENGKLVRALTRGDGEIGLDITDRISRIVPTILEANPDFTGRIRGEFVLPRKVFEEKYKPNGAKSPRNTAAGFLNQKEFDESAVHDFLFIAYSVVDKYGEEHISHSAWAYHLLSNNGFITAKYDLINKEQFDINKAEELLNTLSLYEWRTKNGDYRKDTIDCDGFVSSEHDLETGNYELFAIKWNVDSTISTVTNIKWNATRTGKYVPIIEIEPVELVGATIRNVSAFNAKYILDNKIGIGSIVRIVRSGDIIPYITEVLLQGKVDIPQNCEVCGGKLEWSGVDLVCPNKDCGNIEKKDLEVWSNVLGNVEGLGTTLKMKFFELMGVNSVEDLYNNKNYLDDKGSVQKKKFNEMLKKLWEDEVDIVDALCALNIPRLGRTTAVKLATRKDLIEELLEEDQFSNIPQLQRLVGHATTESILKNLKKFRRLLLLKDRIVYDKDSNVNSNVLKICVTGGLENFKSRKEFFKTFEGKIVETDVAECDYLINNDINSNSSKNRKAKELGKPIISEAQFLEMMKSR